MKKFVALMLALAAALAATNLARELGWQADSLALSLALLLISAYCLGELFREVSLPRVSGYMAAGLLLGPYGLALLGTRQVANLGLITDFALALIALAAGGEMDFSVMRKRLRTIGILLVSRLLLVVVGVTALVILAAPLFPFLSPLPFRTLAVIGLLFAVLAYATSPSTLMAVIAELRARGPFTAIALATTVAIDVLVVLLFAVTVSFGAVLLDPESAFSARMVGLVAAQIGVSFALGALLALGLHLYLSRVGKELALVVLAIGFLVARLTPMASHALSDALGTEFHLEALLICLGAGFFLRNFSRQGADLIHALDRSALPVYVAFFALTGAALDVRTIRDFWQLAFFLFFIRYLWLQVSGMVAARIAREPRVFGFWFGPALSAQAGVSLGLAEMLRTRFPTLGATLAPLFVAVIVINQLIGPILLKTALTRTGEANRIALGGDD